VGCTFLVFCLSSPPPPPPPPRPPSPALSPVDASGLPGERICGVTLTLDQKLRPHPDAVDTELDGNEVALLHLEDKSYYSLNLTGMRIWQGLKQGFSLREISRRLQEEFRVEAETADRSVLDLVSELAEQNLVQPAE
jgi:Coenzyme PQQ synthesis protein D (PqqD)